MITDPGVFDDNHLPHRLLHRDGLVDELSSAFDSARRGARADHVLISGPSGVGKTALARHTLGKLEAFADVDHAYVECLGATTGQVLHQALEEQGVSLPRNTPLHDVTNRLRDEVTAPYILILDEADDLPSTDIIEKVTDSPFVSIVVICHDEERWLSRAPQHVRHSMRTTLQVDRFGVDELVDVLRRRADLGLRGDVVDGEQLAWIADEVAGVAREGIQSLRAAAELADERGHDEIRDVDVRDSFERARYEMRVANLASLAFHHHVLYELIRERDGIQSRDLHARYEALEDELYQGVSVVPIGDRARRNKLAKLREYGLVEYEGDQQRVYRVVDASIASPVDVGVASSRRP